MTLLQAVAIVIGVGFILALISSLRTWNTLAAGKPRLADLAIPFALRWALYSSGVALALGVQYLLLNVRA